MDVHRSLLHFHTQRCASFRDRNLRTRPEWFEQAQSMSVDGAPKKVLLCDATDERKETEYCAKQSLGANS